MSSGIGRELLGVVRDAVQEMVWEQTERKVFRIQQMDITRAAASLIDANVEEETIERFLRKYWDLRPSEAHRFIRDGEDERKI